VGWCGGVRSFKFQLFNSSSYRFSDFNSHFSIAIYLRLRLQFHVSCLFMSLLLRIILYFQFSISIFKIEDSESTTDPLGMDGDSFTSYAMKGMCFHHVMEYKRCLKFGRGLKL